MKYLAIFALISFVAIGIFGFTGMLVHESIFMQCAKSLAGVGNCSDASAMGLMHTRIYQGFTQALIVLIVLALSTFATNLFVLPKIRVSAFSSEFDFEQNSFRQRLFSWISLRQSMDPLA